MTPNFTRKIEDFTCEHCGFFVAGDGYTNHCPRCLYSKHVDLNPGDRASGCLGLMAPVEFLTKNGEEKLLHKCLTCGHTKLNRLAREDNRQELLKIMNNY
jgi:ribosomal protein L37AE/L43A